MVGWIYLVAVGLLVTDAYGKQVMMDDKRPTPDKDDTVYTFAFATDNSPFEFVDPVSQTLMGFSVDVVREVCEEMDKSCQWLALQDFSSCWDEQEKMSRGLNSHWYHACVGLLNTKERSLVYSFRGEYSREPTAYLYVRGVSFINTIEEAVASSVYRVGFVAESWLSSSCLRRNLSWDILTDQVQMFSSQSRLQRALENGDVDIAFLEEAKITSHAGIRRLGSLDEPISCALAGPGISTRKDKAHLFDWFDHGLQMIKDSGKYTLLCNSARAGVGDPKCVDF